MTPTDTATASQTASTVFPRIFDPANRADPYPLYAELRTTPVARMHDGTYVVSTYDEIVALLHDPRVSSDAGDGPAPADATPTAEGEPLDPHPAFIALDPPDHDRLRAQAMRPFGPPHTPTRIDDMRPRLAQVATHLIDRFAGKDHVDIVDDFAYPLPVTAICELLGVPLEDEQRFHQWSQAFIDAIDPGAGTVEQRMRRRAGAEAELRQYLNELADAHARQPGDDLISGLLTDPGPHGHMPRKDLLSTSVLLLIAGHETTVNLITNGMLTLLRHPDVLDHLRTDPDLAVPLVEELLRYEPPVQFLPNRHTLTDIDIAGTTIPEGSPLMLMLAAGSRDPNRFPDPDRFDPTRTDNQHLGFGNGIHYCFGAALARVEAQIALAELARRLVAPRLLADPPPYRNNAVLRGPAHLPVAFDRLLD